MDAKVFLSKGCFSPSIKPASHFQLTLSFRSFIWCSDLLLLVLVLKPPLMLNPWAKVGEYEAENSNSPVSDDPSLALLFKFSTDDLGRVYDLQGTFGIQGIAQRHVSSDFISELALSWAEMRPVAFCYCLISNVSLVLESLSYKLWPGKHFDVAWIVNSEREVVGLNSKVGFLVVKKKEFFWIEFLRVVINVEGDLVSILSVILEDHCLVS